MGIVRLSDGDVPWTAVPGSVVDTVLAATTAEQVIDTMVGDDPWPTALQRRLLHPGSGAAATLVQPSAATTVLDLGSDLAALPSALVALGAGVVRADWSYARLRAGHLLHPLPSVPAVHLGAGDPLPWPDGAFHLVFADLQEVERAARLTPDPTSTRARLLSELSRVLADDGTAVISSRNALEELRGPPQPAGSARRTVRLPDVGPAIRSPWGGHHLRRAGLRVERMVLPRPDRADPRRLIPEERLQDHLLQLSASSGPRRHLARLLGTVPGAARWLVQDYFLLATKAGTASARPTTLGELVLDEPGPAPVTLVLSDARVAVAGQRRFAKIPLSLDQQRALVSEVEKTDLARGTAFAAFVLPAGRVERWHDVPYSVFPRVRERQPDLAESVATVGAVLLAPDAGEVGALDTTASWKRLSSDRGSRDASEIGATDLRASVLSRLGDAVVPIGPTHGDLHPGNVLAQVDGPPLLVDWNRFEPDNPLLLDAVYASVRLHVLAHRGTSLASGLLAFVDGSIDGVVAQRAADVLGGLGRADAVRVLLLDRIVSYSLPRRRHKPWTLAPLQDAVAAVLSIPGRP